MIPIVLIGVGALSFGYDVQRLNWNWFDWFVLVTIVLGYRGEHL